jgi:hypothetical protein
MITRKSDICIEAFVFVRGVLERFTKKTVECSVCMNAACAGIRKRE